MSGAGDETCLRAAFPWEQVIAFGLGTLKLAPDAFWRMTPRELAVIINAAAPLPASPRRADFAELLRRFPD